MVSRKKPVMPETRGRKPAYGDLTDLRTKIDEYFLECEQQRVFADAAGMRIYLKLTKQQIMDMCDPDVTENAEDYQDIFQYAIDRRESLLTRKMVTDPKAAVGCKAALALPDNGGWSEKAEKNNDRKINIKVSKEDEELFK